MRFSNLVILVFFIPTGCVSIKTTYNFQAGASWGGIIEDPEIDAVTGATKIGISLVVHPAININRRLVETGLDFITYNQSWIYLDAGENFDGKTLPPRLQVRLILQTPHLRLQLGCCNPSPQRYVSSCQGI